MNPLIFIFPHPPPSATRGWKRRGSFSGIEGDFVSVGGSGHNDGESANKSQPSPSTKRTSEGVKP